MVTSVPLVKDVTCNGNLVVFVARKIKDQGLPITVELVEPTMVWLERGCWTLSTKTSTRNESEFAHTYTRKWWQQRDGRQLAKEKKVAWRLAKLSKC